METYCVRCKNYNNNNMLEELSKIDECSYQILLFLARKN